LREAAHERRDLYEDDLTDERGPTPVQREEVAHTLRLDPEQESDVSNE
jgi:hypothetical protein